MSGGLLRLRSGSKLNLTVAGAIEGGEVYITDNAEFHFYAHNATQRDVGVFFDHRASSNQFGSMYLNGNTSTLGFILSTTPNGSASINNGSRINNGILILDGSLRLFSSYFAGSINDNGGTLGLRLIGGTDLKLTNAGNSFSGGIAIESGSRLLVYSNGALGWGDLHLNSGKLSTQNASFTIARDIYLYGGNGTLDPINSTDVLTIVSAVRRAAIAPSANLIKDGAGTLILLNPNNLYNETIVVNGTLIGDGRSIGGNIRNASHVVFNINNLIDSYAGDVTGHNGRNGRMFKRGDGQLKLTGHSSLDWEVERGQLFTAAERFSNNVFLHSGTELIFNQGADALYNHLLYGAGTLTKTGASQLTLTQNQQQTIADAKILEGTLQFGNGGNTGMLQGNILNNATLAFNRSDTVQYRNLISGSGTLEQRGTGTTVLTNDHTYTGGTVIRSGVLQIGDGAITGSVRGDITNLATLAFNRSNTLQYDGIISGIGALEQRGTGTLVLVGNNTYSGNTTIRAGALQIGAGGSSGAVRGNITNLTTLVFNRSDTHQYDGVISGSGDLEQRGTGTLVLAGNHTYSGNTTVRTGTLQIGAGGGTGEVRGNITNLATLVFNRSDIYKYDGIISGAGVLEQRGTGTLVLANNNIYAGNTTIHAGTLQIGAGGGTGAVRSNITNLATLAFNRSDTYQYDSIISGTGDLEQRGTGTLVLTGKNTYSGSTVLRNGTLQIDAAENLGQLHGGILQFVGGTLSVTKDLELLREVRVDTGNARFLIAPTTTLTLNGALSGTGNLIKTGAGSLALRGLIHHSGDTQVHDGLLQFGDKNMTANNGPLLQQLGALTIHKGTLALYGPIPLNVIRDVHFTDNTSLLLRANPKGPGLIANRLKIDNHVKLEVSNLLNTQGLQLNDDTVLNEIELIRTLNGIDGDFNTVAVDNFDSPVDYLVLSAGKSADNLRYLAGYGLTWLALNNRSHGTFTLDQASDRFLVTTRLQDQATNPVTGWDGKTLTKAGHGTLILGADNTYSGGTTIRAGTLQLGHDGDTGAVLGPIVNHGTLAFNRRNTLRVDGEISGNGAVRQRGSGTIVLTGHNRYTGGTYIEDGALEVSRDVNLGAATSELIFAGGTLDVKQSFSTQRAIRLAQADARLRIADNVRFDLNSPITGAGDLVKLGAGILRLGPQRNTYRNTQVHEGELIGDSDSIAGHIHNAAVVVFEQNSDGHFDGDILALNQSAGKMLKRGTHRLTLNGNSQLDWNIEAGDLTTAAERFNNNAHISTHASLTFEQQTDARYGGRLDGDGALVKTGDHLLTLTQDQRYTGGTTIHQGTLQLGDGGDTGMITGDVQNHGTLAFNRGNTVRFNHLISGTGSLEQRGTGTTILSQEHTYTGGTVIRDGVLQLGDGGARGSIQGPVLNQGKLAFNRSDTLQFDGLISGTGLLRQRGAGTLVLNADNTYSGGTWLENGQLRIDADHRLGDTAGDLHFAGGILVTTQSFAMQRAIQLTRDAPFDIAASTTLDLHGALTGLGDLVKRGAGTLRLHAATNAYGHTRVLDGILIGNSASLSGDIRNASTVIFDQHQDGHYSGQIDELNGTRGKMLKRGDAQLALTGHSHLDWEIEAGDLRTAAERFLGNARMGLHSTLTFDQQTDARYNGLLSGAGQFVKTGAGATELTQHNTYIGGTRLHAGVLRISDDHNLGDASGALIFAGGTLAVTRNIDTHRAMTLDHADAHFDVAGLTTLNLHGALSGTGNLFKTGTGTLRLHHTHNTYDNTQVKDGILIGDADTFRGAIHNAATVVFEQTLDRRYAGNISALNGASGSMIKRGTSKLILDGGSTLNWDLQAGALITAAERFTGDIILATNTQFTFDQQQAGQYAGTVSGRGDFFKTGDGTLTLKGNLNIAGVAHLDGGELVVDDNPTGMGVRQVGRLAVHQGRLSILSPATLNIATHAHFADHAELAIRASVSPNAALRADSITLGEDTRLDLSGISDPSTLDKVLIQTTSGIHGDFEQITIGGFTGKVDYLTLSTRKSAGQRNFLATYALSWQAQNSTAHGTFTLTNAHDRFDIGTVLDDQAANPATGWDGRSLTKAGDGTLVLSAANTYTGGTTIQAGTLQIGNGGNTGSIIGDVINHGRLAIERSDTWQFDGAISGSGALEQRGTGTTILTGENHHTGGTTIRTGILQIGDGGTRGSLLGPVLNQSELSFNRSDTLHFDGLIEGSGLVRQRGTGTTELTALNAYTGDTYLENGVLAITADAHLGALSNHLIFTGGELEVRRSFESQRAIKLEQANARFNIAVLTTLGLTHPIKGSGDLLKRGPGTLRLDHADNTYGNTLVEDGTLMGHAHSISGDIQNASQVVFEQTTAGHYAGDISALNGQAGKMIKTGAAVLTLDGQSRLDWDIQAGELVSAAERFSGNARLALDATLRFAQQKDAQYDGLLSGSGVFIKTGQRQLTLTGAHTHTGGTTIEDGTLQLGDGGMQGALQGDILNHGTLAVNRSDTLQLDGAITGQGKFEQRGTGTTVLGGENTYNGGTLVRDGILQIGDGATSGSLASDVLNHATLAFNRSDTLRFDGLIEGSGALVQRGSGLTLLTRNHRYTGGTHIQRGALQLGDGGTTGNLSGDILNDGALHLNRRDTWHLGSDISGRGDLVHTGSGTTVLRGLIDLGGQALIDDGTLVFGDGQSKARSHVNELLVRRGIASIQTPAQLAVTQRAVFEDHTTLSIHEITGGPTLLADSMQIGQDVRFNLSGISSPALLDKVLIRTTKGIQGNFAPISVGGFLGPVDYLNLSTRKSADNLEFLATYYLSWFAQNNLSHGKFTLADQREWFNVGAVLQDQAANAVTGWDGKSLVKSGAGTLVLSADNLYTGTTLIEDGTLQLGNGGDTGSILGDVINHDLLAFNRNDTWRFNGIISGRGALVQRGTGTTVLTADNPYLGGTFLEDGRLQVSKDSQLGDARGGITFNGGTLATTESFDTERAITLTKGDARFHIAADTTLGLRNTLTGQGDLVKLGAGTLRLDHIDNAYGNTHVEDGILIGQAHTFSGHIRNAAQVVFEQNSDAHFAGDIVGLNDINGKIVKRGDATLVLDGRSALDWTIEAGQLRTTVERFRGHAHIALDGTLNFAQDTYARYSGALSGAGQFLKTGKSKLEYDGEGGQFRGLTTIAGGEFIVGSSADQRHRLGGSMRVLDGATLGGHGVLGHGQDALIAIGKGGTLSPGNSIGTLTVDGNLAFEAGSRFSIEADPDRQLVDRVNVTGDIRILNGATTDINATGQYALRSRQTILKADGNLAGKFDKVNSNFAFLAPKLTYDYDLNTVDLELNRNEFAFADKAWTRNQRATAAASDSIGVDAAHPVYDAIALLADDDTLVRNTLDQLSGEIHTSMHTALIDASRLLRDTTSTRLRDAYARPGASPLPTQLAPSAASTPGTGGTALWAITHGDWRTTQSDGNAGKLGQQAHGLLAGVDAPIGRASRLGILTGYSRNSLSASDRASSARSESYHFGVYGGTQFGAAALQAGVAHTEHDLNTKRHPSFAGFSDDIKSRYGARTTQLYADLGYRVPAAPVALEPFVSVAHVWQHSNEVQEIGELAALRIGSQGTRATFTTLGLRGETSFQWGRMQLVGTGALGWQHALGGSTTPLSTHQFNAGDRFTIAGLPIARNVANVELGLNAQLARRTALGFSYRGQYASGTQQHGLRLQLDMRF